MKKDYHKTILLVEDDELFRESISDCLSDKYKFLTADSVDNAQAILAEKFPDIIILDINLPRKSGIELLKYIRTSDPHLNTPVIMLTALRELPKVVESIKLGAFDYLVKPVNTEELSLTIDRAWESCQIKRELEQRRKLQLCVNKEYKLVGNSPALKRIREEISVLSKSDSTVLIEGATGTGKELIARTIHNSSPRADKTFVAINCGAIPKDLFESELFGHKKGSFSGARSDEMGKFRLAHQGTILLDEVCDLPLDAQIKLLRVLEERQFYSVGSNKLVTVDVRILASTNRNPREMIRQNVLREDLYFRLNACSIKIPPLKERPEDILLLTEYFMKHYNIKFGKQFEEISTEAKEILLHHPWKGNGRELRNLIERVVLFEDGTALQPEHLSILESFTPPNGFSISPDFPENGIDSELEKTERDLILKALHTAKWNKTRAAELLKLSPPTLSYRLEKYGIK